MEGGEEGEGIREMRGREPGRVRVGADIESRVQVEVRS